MKPWRKRIAVYSLLAAALVGISWYFYWDATRTKEPQVIYVSTPPDAVERMLEMAQVTKDDVVYDLGCGDGRIVVAAAKKYGCRAVGVELRTEAVEDARRNVAEAGVEDLVEIRQADILTTDFSDATVVAMYLLPDFNVRLIPKLNQLPPGSRVVSYTFKMPGVPPKEKAQWMEGANERTVYLWTTPIPAPVLKPERPPTRCVKLGLQSGHALHGSDDCGTCEGAGGIGAGVAAAGVAEAARGGAWRGGI